MVQPASKRLVTEATLATTTSTLASKAPLASPTFTGTVTVPTPTAGTSAANKDYVDTAVSGVGGSGVSVGVDKLGIIAVDSFTGTDVQRWDAAYAAAAAASHSSGLYKRSIQFDARNYDLRSASTKAWFDGLRLVGPGGGRGREFRETNRIQVNPAGFFDVPNGTRDHEIKGLSFESTGWHFAPFATDNSVGDIEDLTIWDCGFQGGQVMQGTYTRLCIGPTYTNGVTGTAYKMGGSDNRLWMDGDSYLSTTNTGLGDTVPVLSLGMGLTEVGAIYVTPQGGYGLEVFYTKGGLIFNGTKFDSTLRSNIYTTSLSAPPAAAAMIKVKSSSQNVVFNNVWCFNGNADALSSGNMFEFTGTGHDHLINSPRLVYKYDTQVADKITGPAIYTNTSRITIANPNWNVGTSGADRTFRQMSSGLINLVGDHAGQASTIITG